MGITKKIFIVIGITFIVSIISIQVVTNIIFLNNIQQVTGNLKNSMEEMGRKSSKDLLFEIQAELESSLLRGDAIKFVQRLKEKQENLKSIMEVSFTSALGEIIHSTNSGRKGVLFNQDILAEVSKAKGLVIKQTDHSFDLYFPSYVTGNQIRMNPDLKRGSLYGILFVQSSMDEITTSINSALTMYEASRNKVILLNVFTIFITIGFSLTIIGLFLKKYFEKPILNNITSLSNGTKDVLSTTKQLSSNSKLLSSEVSKQSTAVDKTVLSIQEISKKIHITSDFSQNGKKLSHDVNDKAQNGVKTMKEMLLSIENIRAGNDNLNTIIDIINQITTKTKVINDIVFKTQLLSFNASIEAQRAGQHGKGFAVVAEEVGKLARSSGKAAHEISTLIKNSQIQVEEMINKNKLLISQGYGISENASKIFNEIASDIQLITEQINSIAQASDEQNGEVALITNAIDSVKDASISNNRVALETKDTAQILNEQNKNFTKATEEIHRIIAGNNSNNSLTNPKISSFHFINKVKELFNIKEQ